jgi:tetratricopeptide (TPR) repeat protein
MNARLVSVAWWLAVFMSSLASAQDIGAQIDRGRALRMEGKVDQSIETLKDATAKDSSNFRAQYNLALGLAGTDQKVAADSAFLKAIEAGEAQGMPDPTIYNSYGWFLMQQGKYSAAEQQFNKGVKHIDALSDGSKQRLLNNLGMLYMQTDRIDKAQAQFSKTASAFDSAGAKRSLAIIQTIKKNEAKTPPPDVNGLLYLGQTQADGNSWMAGSTTTNAASPSAVRAAGELKLSQAANVHAEAMVGGASVPGSSIGVLNVGDAVKVLDVRESPAATGGKYVWAKVQKSNADGSGSH